MKGPSIGRRLLIFAGYSAFFLFALVTFVYVTLPLDTVKAYLVRKAADEYGADLVIEDLSTWGLSGVQAENLTLTFRPTADEEAAMEVAREARKAWDAEHGGARAGSAKASDAPGDKPAGDDAPASDAAAAPKTATKRLADIDPEAEIGEAGDRPDRPERAAADDPADATAEKKPPPMPAGPRPIAIASLKAKVGLFSLLRGGLSGRVEASLAGGTLDGELENRAEAYHLLAHWDALDLRELAILRRKLDVPVAGHLGGEIDVEVPRSDDGKSKLTAAVGHVALKFSDTTLGPGKLPMKSGGFEYVEIPLVRIGVVEGRLVLEKKKATVETFTIKGKDLEGEVTGYIELKDKLASLAPRLHLRFKLADDFLETHKDLKVLMTSVPKIKSGTVDGYTGFMINGSFTDPKFVPKKESPYKAGASGAKATAGDARKKDKDPSGKGKPAKPAKAPPSAALSQGARPVPAMVVPPPAQRPATVVAPEAVPVAPIEPAEPAEAVPEPAEPVAEPTEAPPEPTEDVEAPAEHDPSTEPTTEGTENPEAPAEHGTEGGGEE